MEWTKKINFLECLSSIFYFRYVDQAEKISKKTFEIQENTFSKQTN